MTANYWAELVRVLGSKKYDPKDWEKLYALRPGGKTKESKKFWAKIDKMFKESKKGGGKCKEK